MKAFNLLLVPIIAISVIGCGSDGDSGDDDLTNKGINVKKVPIQTILDEFMDCKDASTDKYDCKEFTAKAICSMFGIVDFVDEQNERGFVEIKEIKGIVDASSMWKRLGDASDQDVLDEANALANGKTPVLAISDQEGIGNVAIIISGEMTSSTSWGLKVPNSTSFFMKNHSRSFIGKSLAYAWSKPNGIDIYARVSD